MGDPNLPDSVKDCGCCAGLGAETPVGINNRAGLTAIAYRVGAHAQFKASMLAALSSAEYPALGALQTREDDDFSIALLDAWATVADVLTFYQERIANESYLRTATERLSLIEMARLIGYQPRPGVAASTYLAFTVEDAPGSPPRASVDIGTKAQSIPGPGEQAQMFETVEKIEARAAWNAIKPRLTAPQTLSTDMSTIFLKGTSADLKAGDRLLIVAAKPDGSETDKVFRRIKSVSVDQTAQRTTVGLEGLPFFLGFVFAPISAASSFSFNAQSLSSATIGQSVLNKAWGQADLSAFAQIQGWSIESVFQNLNAQLSAAAPPADTGVFAFRVRASLFGHNAPYWNLLDKKTRDEISTGATDWPLDEGAADQIHINAVHNQIVPDSWAVIKRGSSEVIARVQGVSETGLSRYGVSGKSTQLDLDANVALSSFSQLRQTTVYAQSEQLALADAPISDPVAGHVIKLDQFYEGLSAGQNVVLTGERADLAGVRASEAATLAEITHDTAQGLTTLTLAADLANQYKRDTVTINANIARATHGETAQEVLGSGDASQAYQRFTLRQPPLTHTSASTPSGTASSLQIRVNDLLWHEAPSLYGHGPDERIFVTRLGDDGKTTVVFGDGRTGARLPSGQENVRATYRKGIGRGGLVKAEQISLLLTRPLGVKGVINPIASSGAADAETLDDARTNAPLTVMTLDRIVSLRDYEDFARAYAGIAKAHATWTWSGQVRGVFVTVAGPNGAEVKPDSDLYKNLLAAMQQSGDPHVPLRVQTYRPAFFRLAANVKVHPDYLPDKVLAAVEQALRAQFSFAARQFGQPVALSEVVAVMQSVAGVVAVDVDKLYRFDDAFAGLKALLPAAAPQAGDKGTVAAAELLTLDPSPLHDLGVMP
ncbi:MAG: putative baseplate assembly protein [Acidobacteriota bacterium]